MSWTSLACLLIATPTLAFGDPAQGRTWLGGELSQNWGDLASHPSGSEGPRSWAVARVIAGDPLLQTRPIVRDAANSLETEMLRDVTHCTIAAHRHFDQHQPHRPVVACRYPQWAGICVADDLVQRWADEPERRDELKAKLPDFLRRELPGKRSEALLFFAALAQCFHQGSLSPLRSEPQDILQALHKLQEDLAQGQNPEHQTSLWLTEGRMLYVMHSASPLVRRLGPKPDRRAQHTLRHKAKEGVPTVLVTTALDPSAEGSEPISASVFAVDAHNPEHLITL